MGVRFAMIGQGPIADRHLSLTDLRVLLVLALFADRKSRRCYPKRETIATLLGIRYRSQRVDCRNEAGLAKQDTAAEAVQPSTNSSMGCKRNQWKTMVRKTGNRQTLIPASLKP